MPLGSHLNDFEKNEDKARLGSCESSNFLKNHMIFFAKHHRKQAKGAVSLANARF